MKPLLLLTWSAIKRNLGQAIGLAIFVAMGAFMLHSGLVLATDYPQAFDRQAEQHNVPDFAIVQSVAAWHDTQTETLSRDDRVQTWETETVVFSSATPMYNGTELPSTVMFSRLNSGRTLDVPTIHDGGQPLRDDSVYVPYTFMSGGYHVGDSFTVSIGNAQFTYVVAGFVDELFYGSMLHDWYRFYLSDAAWERLWETVPGGRGILLSVKVGNPDDTDHVYVDYLTSQVYSNPLLTTGGFGMPVTVESSTLDETRFGRMAFTTITAGVLVLFAFLVVATAMVVIRFRVINTIQETTPNIGALYALGYTSQQVALTLVFQFGGVALVAAIVGLAASYLSLPGVSTIMSAQSGMDWRPSAAVAAAIVSFVASVGSVTAMAAVAALRLRRLTPLAALRDGLEQQSYKHNYLPLERSRGPLIALLSAKQALHSVGQVATIGVIMLIVSFMATVTTATYYHLGTDRYAYAKMMMGEMPDISVYALPGHTQDVLDNVRSRPTVERAFLYDFQLSALVDGGVTELIVTDDFSQTNPNLVYQSRYPQSAQEIVLSADLSAMLGKTEGDTVTLETGGRAESFRITGLVQMYTDSGLLAAVTEDGIRRANPTYNGSVIYIYVTDPSQSQIVLDGLKAELGDAVFGGINTRSLADARLGAPSDMMRLSTQATAGVAAVVIALVLFLVVTTMLRRRRRAFGVEKAVGFTSPQIVAQVVGVYLPTSVTAITIGVVTAHASYEGLLGLMLSPMGIKHVFDSPPVWVSVVMGVGLVVFSAIAATVISSRVRRITVRSLVTE